jgi:ribosome-binding protein aMBF1 (putative translation factor)
MDTLDKAAEEAAVSPLGDDTEEHRQQLESRIVDQMAFAKAEISEKVARAIISYRIRLGLNQKQAAKAFNMKESALCRLERGDHVPNVETMLRVANMTGTQLRLDFVETTTSVPRKSAA